MRAMVLAMVVALTAGCMSTGVGGPSGPEAGTFTSDPTAAYARAGLIVVGSPYSVDETLDRLTGIVEARGAKVFARVDHAAGAATVDVELPGMQMLMFGNPKLGTPVLGLAPTAGIDLPLRVLAWEQNAATFVAYPDMTAFAPRHGLMPDDPAIKPIAAALDGLVGAAVAAD